MLSIIYYMFFSPIGDFSRRAPFCVSFESRECVVWNYEFARSRVKIGFGTAEGLAFLLVKRDIYIVINPW